MDKNFSNQEQKKATSSIDQRHVWKPTACTILNGEGLQSQDRDKGAHSGGSYSTLPGKTGSEQQDKKK